jgi:hypothetical protein
MMGERQIPGGGLSVGPEELERAAAAAQRLGLRLLRDLLYRGGGLKPRHWLPGRDVLLFDRVPFRRVRWWRLLLDSMGFFRQAGSANAFALANQTDSRRKPASAIRVLLSRLGVAWHGPEANAIPDRLWELLGVTAWSAPTFQLEAGRILTGHMGEHLIAAAVDFPVPRLRPEVLWLVIATAPIQDNLLTRLTSRRARRAIVRLTSIAERIALRYRAAVDGNAAEYSDFWEEWIAWHIWRSGSVAASRTGLVHLLEAMQSVSQASEPLSAAALPQIRALQAVYAKWYPENKEPRRVQRR